MDQLQRTASADRVHFNSTNISNAHASQPGRLRALAATFGLAIGLLVLLMAAITTTGQAAPNDPVVLPDSLNAPAAPLGTVTIGDYVWHDFNENGDWVNDAAEQQYTAGINGVKLNLYVDLNRNSILEPGTEYVAFTTTTNDPSISGSSGWYEFEVTTYFTPTTYWVQVDPANFAPLGALDGYHLTSQVAYGGLTIGEDAECGQRTGRQRGLRLCRVGRDRRLRVVRHQRQ